MSVHRSRGSKHASDDRRATEDQAVVEDLVDELRALWSVLPAALARDSAGLLGEKRHATGAVEGSAAPANVEVIHATARIETGVWKIAAEAVPLLRIDHIRTTTGIIDRLASWHLQLARAGQPLVEHLRRDLKGWVRDGREAIGTKRHDEKLALLCPEHRDTTPTHLRQIGAEAVTARSLLAGPPPPTTLIGPLCARPVFADRCEHESCAWIRDRRLVEPGGRLSDWCLTAGGDPKWLAVDGGDAFTWRESQTIRCPKCRTEWSTTTERRMLARRLAELGDASPDAAALIT